MTVKISVCIVAYNNYDDIKAALSSMELFTSPKLTKKIYIVDNGTSISSLSKVKEFRRWLERYRDVEYIDTGQNLGFGKGHNYILDKLDSEYHAIVNPDILFYEDAFLEIMTWMDEKKDVGMVIPDIRDENGNRQLVYREELTVFDMLLRFFSKKMLKKRREKHTLQDKDYSKPFQVPFGQGSFLVIRTDLFKKLKGFDDKYFMYVEDADLCKRVNQISKLMYFPGAKVVHKWQQGSHGNRTLFKYHVQSTRRYFKKWGVKWV